MGFLKSYNKVRRFEVNAALTFNDNYLNVSDDQNIFAVADNIDHKTANLDGMNTVHWMGMIFAISPCSFDNNRLFCQMYRFGFMQAAFGKTHSSFET